VVEELADREGTRRPLLGLGERGRELVGGLQAELRLGEGELLLGAADGVVDRDERGSGALVELLEREVERVVGRELVGLSTGGSRARALAAAEPGDGHDDADGREPEEEDGAERDPAAAAPGRGDTAGGAALAVGHAKSLGGCEGGAVPVVL